MVYAKALLISALTATLVIAAPTESGNKNPEEAGVTSSERNGGPEAAAYSLIQVCRDVNFKGNCVTWTGNLNTCYGVGEYNDAISSCKVAIGVDCTLYEDSGCNGNSIVITSSARDLREQYFNDMASSFRCFSG